jgi:hypothetical protein
MKFLAVSSQSNQESSAGNGDKATDRSAVLQVPGLGTIASAGMA